MIAAVHEILEGNECLGLLQVYDNCFLFNFVGFIVNCSFPVVESVRWFF